MSGIPFPLIFSIYFSEQCFAQLFGTDGLFVPGTITFTPFAAFKPSYSLSALSILQPGRWTVHIRRILLQVAISSQRTLLIPTWKEKTKQNKAKQQATPQLFAYQNKSPVPLFLFKLHFQSLIKSVEEMDSPPLGGWEGGEMEEVNVCSLSVALRRDPSKSHCTIAKGILFFRCCFPDILTKLGK